jgi:ribosomal protein L37AE/L43A
VPAALAKPNLSPCTSERLECGVSSLFCPSGVAALVQSYLNVVVESAANPRADEQYPGTWREFRAWFGEETSCIAYLEQLRWKAGFRCPECEGGKGWRLADERWFCAACNRRISVTAGTVIDRSRVLLQDWFTAAWDMTNQKHGLSLLGLQQPLGLGSYQTAWTMNSL